MTSETKAAIIGAIVSALISGAISIWSMGRIEILETQNRTFQERLEEKSISRTLAASRANQLSEVSRDLLRNYGDVTAVINMPSSEWYKLNSYKNMLKVLGADDAWIELEKLYQKTDRNKLNPNQPGRKIYYDNLESLTLSLRKTIDQYYEAQ
ncbi:MAG: hypothetical protein ACRBHB_21820 [Arenicella sp.]